MSKLSKFELEYGGDKNITHTVEVLLTDVTSDDEDDQTIFTTLVNDFYYYLEDSGLEDYWVDSYEIYPFYKGGAFRASLGAKFVFVRLISHKESSEFQSMGSGTQWVSDVIDLMKKYLCCMRVADYCCHTEIYLDARLIFRLDGKQFEWK